MHEVEKDLRRQRTPSLDPLSTPLIRDGRNPECQRSRNGQHDGKNRGQLSVHSLARLPAWAWRELRMPAAARHACLAEPTRVTGVPPWSQVGRQRLQPGLLKSPQRGFYEPRIRAF